MAKFGGAKPPQAPSICAYARLVGRQTKPCILSTVRSTVVSVRVKSNLFVFLPTRRTNGLDRGIGSNRYFLSSGCSRHKKKKTTRLKILQLDQSPCVRARCCVPSNRHRPTYVSIIAFPASQPPPLPQRKKGWQHVLTDYGWRSPSTVKLLIFAPPL